MDGLQWKTLLKWMIWGYHYFWKHPYVVIYYEHMNTSFRMFSAHNTPDNFQEKHNKPLNLSV